MTTLVMIPGMMCDARLFGPQINAFSSEYDFFIPSLKGHSTIEGLADKILQKSPPNFCLLGLSMGGIIAMEMLQKAPSRISRIALLDTNPLAEKDGVKQRRMPQIQAAKDGELAKVMRDEMKPNYLSDGPKKKDVLDLCMDMALDIGAEVFIEQSNALMNRIDQTRTLKSANVPALILCGREDVLCPVERHELMHDLMPSSVLEIIEGAGHLPVLERPEQTNQKIRDWLAA